MGVSELYEWAEWFVLEAKYQEFADKKAQRKANRKRGK